VVAERASRTASAATQRTTSDTCSVGTIGAGMVMSSLHGSVGSVVDSS